MLALSIHSQRIQTHFNPEFYTNYYNELISNSNEPLTTYNKPNGTFDTISIRIL